MIKNSILLIFLFIYGLSYAQTAKEVEKAYNKLYKKLSAIADEVRSEVKAHGPEHFGKTPKKQLENMYKLYFAKLRETLPVKAKPKFDRMMKRSKTLFSGQSVGFSAAFRTWDKPAQDLIEASISKELIKSCVNYGVALHEITHAVEFYTMSEMFGRDWADTSDADVNARMWLKSEHLSHRFELSYLSQISKESRADFHRIMREDRSLLVRESENLKRKVRASKKAITDKNIKEVAAGAGYDLKWLKHKCMLRLLRGK